MRYEDEGRSDWHLDPSTLDEIVRRGRVRRRHRRFVGVTATAAVLAFATLGLTLSLVAAATQPSVSHTPTEHAAPAGYPSVPSDVRSIESELLARLGTRMSGGPRTPQAVRPNRCDAAAAPVIPASLKMNRNHSGPDRPEELRRAADVAVGEAPDRLIEAHGDGLLPHLVDDAGPAA